MYQDVRKAWTKKRKHSRSVPECPENMDKKEEKSGCMESKAGGIVKAENEKGA